MSKQVFSRTRDSQSKAFETALSPMGDHISQMGVESYVRAPIVSDGKWGLVFLQTLFVYGPLRAISGMQANRCVSQDYRTCYSS